MEKYLDIIRTSTLFRGIGGEDVLELMRCLGCTIGKYRRGEFIFMSGSKITRAGIVLEGKTRAENVNYSGEASIISVFSPGEVFGDVLMTSDDLGSPVNMLAAEDCVLLFVPFENIMRSCTNSCARHSQVRINLLDEISKKFFVMNKKIRYLSNKSLRGRIAEFLIDSMAEAGSRTFNISYSREGLAALLGANRSALSRELSRMQTDGVITFYKNSFKVEDESKLKSCFN